VRKITLKLLSLFIDSCAQRWLLCNAALQCFPQRAALLKSMLNFLKKAIPDPAFADSIRHCELQYLGFALFAIVFLFGLLLCFNIPGLTSGMDSLFIYKKCTCSTH